MLLQDTTIKQLYINHRYQICKFDMLDVYKMCIFDMYAYYKAILLLYVVTKLV
jgi:hypothetical protein